MSRPNANEPIGSNSAQFHAVSPDFNTQRLSRYLAWLCLALAVLLPVAAAVALSGASVSDVVTKLGGGSASASGGALIAQPGWRPMAAWIIGMLPVAIIAYALLRARQSFLLMSQGEYFTRPTVANLRSFAAAMFAAALASAVVPTLVTLLLTSGGSGKTTLSVSLSSQHLVLLLFAGVVWQMARLMAKAAEIAEENAQFV
jgi:Protein of unknown function (DUF2975)